MRRTLVRFDSARLGRADRGWVRAYIGKVCGFSPAPLTRLVRRRAETGAVQDRRARNSGRAFGRVYTPTDIRLLAEVDEAFGALSGLATCELPRFRGGRLCAARSRSTATGEMGTIHLLEGGAYRVSPEIRTFPGWTAEAIHVPMNEAGRSRKLTGKPRTPILPALH